MGRKRKSIIEKSPFKLRNRKLTDGRLSLFLDRSVNGGHEYEFLQLYLMPETSAKAKRQNAQTLRKAEDIQRERTEALLNAKVETVPENNTSSRLKEPTIIEFVFSSIEIPVMCINSPSPLPRTPKPHIYFPVYLLYAWNIFSFFRL